eukprot:956020-Pelagomonas_calceolata.AAC.1
MAPRTGCQIAWGKTILLRDEASRLPGLTRIYQGLGYSPRFWLLVTHSQPVSKTETNSDKNFDNLPEF